MTKNNYIVCSTVRSGSTLLCRTLETLDGFGQPEEYFHRHRLEALNLENSPDDFLQYCHSIFTQDTPDRFGIKMHWWQLMEFLALGRELPQFRDKSDLDILNGIFPNLRFIYLWRRDVTSQAVSAAIASQTGQWEKSMHNTSNKLRPVKFQPWKIYEWEQSLKEQNHCWQTFFQTNQLDYYAITYEDLVESFTENVAQVISHIDGQQNPPSTPLTMPTQRQSNRVNRRFSTYYRLMPKSLLSTLFQLYCRVTQNGGGV
ncbi:MAG: Stf0 family sulfotransferase [Cyanobacteria bacterium P01_D01_bin.156]